MSKFVIQGGNKVSGEITMKGAKNSVLPILASCIVTKSVSVLTNCPNLSDVDSAVKILNKLGCIVQRRSDIIIIDSTGELKSEIDESDAKEMRSSIIFLGALLSRTKKANMSFPGGCELGPRPIDLHIKALRQLGATLDVEHKYLKASAKCGLSPSCVELDFPSVGATENVLISSVNISGTTVIKNAAREPEIVDLANFLNACGADIQGAGSSVITIKGVQSFQSCSYRIMPDRIATTTYMAITAACGGELTLKNTNYKDLIDVLPYFYRAGCKIDLTEYSIKIQSDGQLEGIGHIQTTPYPGFPTDAQPILVAMCAKAKGKSVFEETIFNGRYKYIKGLLDMGADIQVDGKFATVSPVTEFYPNIVKSTDLRGGAALVILACAAKGESEILDIYHIDRGYETMEDTLQSIGIDIKRVSYFETK